MINFQNIDTIDTFENSKGIIALTYSPTINLVAYPDKASGYVKLKNYDKNETILMNAHNSKIAFLAISQDGVFLATASEKGTYIRVFKTENGLFLNEFRRGKDLADIWSITFDPSIQFLMCTTSTGTVYIFSMSSTYKKFKELIKEK
jgi:WD40 repeat protein